MKQKEAIRIVELSRKTKYPKQQALICLIDINQHSKKKYGKRLYSIFELMGLIDMDVALSFSVSNIEELSK